MLRHTLPRHAAPTSSCTACLPCPGLLPALPGGAMHLLAKPLAARTCHSASPALRASPTQTLLAVPLVGLYMGGAAAVRALEARRAQQA